MCHADCCCQVSESTQLAAARRLQSQISCLAPVLPWTGAFSAPETFRLSACLISGLAAYRCTRKRGRRKQHLGPAPPHQNRNGTRRKGHAEYGAEGVQRYHRRLRRPVGDKAGTAGGNRDPDPGLSAGGLQDRQMSGGAGDFAKSHGCIQMARGGVSALYCLLPVGRGRSTIVPHGTEIPL